MCHPSYSKPRFSDSCNVPKTSQPTLSERLERRKENLSCLECYDYRDELMCHPKMPCAALGLTSYSNPRFPDSRREWQCRGHWNTFAICSYKSGPEFVSIYLRLSPSGDGRRRSHDS